MSQLPPDLFPQRPIRSDYERGPSYRTRRLLTILICLAVIGGVAYHFLGGMPSMPGEIPTIKAETTTYKQKPDQPGGIDIPHQDVQVYEALDGKEPGKDQVEHLMPPPETPQSSAPPAMSNNAAPPTPAVNQTENLTPSKAEAPPSLEPPPPPPVQTTVESHIPPPPPPVPTVKLATVPTPAPAPAPAPVVKKLAPTKQSSASAGNADHAVQLASVQDESSAQTMMKSLQSRYASVLGDAELRLVKADLGAKGLFYRIRTQPLTDERATRICEAIKKTKAGCILVRQ